MLKTRVILSSMLIAALIGSLLIDLHFERAYASFVILILAGVLAAIEWNRITRHTCSTYPWLLVAAALLYPVLQWVRIERAWPPFKSDFLFLFLFLFLLLCRAIFSGHVKDGLDRVARTLLGFMLLYFFYRLAPLLLDRENGGGVLITYCLVFTSKCSDMGAFLMGYFLGKRKLIPKVSPGKTVAGAVGGVALPALVGTLLFGLLDLRPPAFGLLLGVVIGAVTIISDLSESLVKRCAGVKDSAGLLPEMGGVLDLIDSLILAAPTGYILLMFL